jgi:hypothetical protein
MKKQISTVLITFIGIFSTINAQVGINIADPHAPLQFKNETVNRKIVLYETGNNDHQFYGFGVNPGILRYQADVTTTDHAFFAGTGATTSNELMRIKGTGNVGIGTSTPNNKLDLGTSLGTSITDVAGKKLAVYNAANGTDFYGLGISPGFLQFHSASTATEAPGMVLTSSGNVGIGAAANTPTNTLDVAGTARVRTITPVTGATVVTPVYSDANGVLVQASPSTTFGGATSNSVTVASGATGTLITGIVQGVYKASVIDSDGCVYVAAAEFFVNNFSFNSSFAIRGVSGLLSPSATKGPTFSETNQTTTVVTWTGKPGCQDGGNSTALNYTLTMPAAGTINVTNNGNVSRAYKIVLTRLD